MTSKKQKLLCILLPSDLEHTKKTTADNPNCKHINFNLDYISFFNYIEESKPKQKKCPTCKLYKFEAEYKEYSLNKQPKKVA